MAGEDPVIKIFVSHRIDLVSDIVANPLYVPVRCGAVFDKRENTGMQGDDTGENISEKRVNYNELTVQYWAWKNAKADYYGLCHYRRYLSFSDRVYKTIPHGLVSAPVLTSKYEERFSLLDSDKMKRIIPQFDFIMPQPAPVAKMPVPHGKAATVKDLWQTHEGLFFEHGAVDALLERLTQLFPEYAAAAKEYFNSGFHIGYNCFVAKRELFDRLCKLQFTMLKRLEAETDLTKYPRTLGYYGEMLFGIFCYYISTRTDCRVDKRQLVLFRSTQAPANRGELLKCYAGYAMDNTVRAATNKLFPLGTKRREKLKNIYFDIFK